MIDIAAMAVTIFSSTVVLIGCIGTKTLLVIGVAPNTNLDFITIWQQPVAIPSAAWENHRFVKIIPCHEVFCEIRRQMTMNDCTRRTFMKTSLATVGSVALASSAWSQIRVPTTTFT